MTTEQWSELDPKHSARLIPISVGTEAQERRAVSVLLSVISAVTEFGRSLLRPVGAPAGKATCFVETEFKLGEKTLRPDGIILVSRGGQQWVALVEAKTTDQPLDPQQIEDYLELARFRNADALITISNQYVATADEHPIAIDKRRLRNLELRHWSWMDILTEARVQASNQEISDPDQAYILEEMIRFLEDKSSGVLGFTTMGKSWTKVRDAARRGQLAGLDQEIDDIASKWEDLARYAALTLTTDLGRDVKHLLRGAARSRELRQRDLKDMLRNERRLVAELQVPDAAGTVLIEADLHGRQIIVSSRVDAPKAGTSRGRVSWLLRQIEKSPDSVTVQAHVPYVRESKSISLTEARSSPSVLYPEGDKEIVAFTLRQQSEVGLRQDDAEGSFIRSVLDATENFYRDVLQKIRPWVPTPARLKSPEQAPEGEQLTQQAEADGQLGAVAEPTDVPQAQNSGEPKRNLERNP